MKVDNNPFEKIPKGQEDAPVGKEVHRPLSSS